MVSRDPKRAARAFDRVNRIAAGRAETELADLGVMADVRRLGNRILERHNRLDGLVNNAGVLAARRTLTADGIESTMAVNYLGPFVLSHVLLDALVAGCGRIVNVSSGGHSSGDLRRAPLEDILRGRAWAGMMKAYGDSKLANILFTFEWMRRMKDTGVVANALHPGVLRTRVWNRNLHPLSLFMQPFRLFMGNPAKGADAIVRLLLPGEASVGGEYLDRQQPARAADQAYDQNLAAELWDVSHRVTGNPGN